MEIRYSRAFVRDLRRVRDASIRRRVERALDERSDAMAKKDKGKGRGRVWDPRYMFNARVELPMSKGKFRNMFPEMVPKPKRT